MTKEEVFENLCSYDERNPMFADIFGDEKPIKGSGKCYCDNCFEGRDKIANELLRLMELIEDSETN